MSSDYDEEFDFAVKSVRKVGEIIKVAFGRAKTVKEKSCYNDLVTETDQLVEDTLKQMLSNQFPSYK